MLDDSDVILRPPFSNSLDLVPNPNAPQGRIHRFTMKSEDSKIYKGISRDKPGEVVPYERSVAVYIPAQYVAGHRQRRSSSCRTDTTRSTTTRFRPRWTT